MRDWISRALSESNGNPSSLRVPFWIWELVLIISFAGVLGYTIYSHFHKPDATFNPIGILGSILAFLGANRTSKIVQKAQENGTPTLSTSEDPIAKL